MLRPDKKYSVYDLRQLKGKRCLTHVHVKSTEEAAAAEAAGIDLLSCSYDSPAAQARLPLLGVGAVTVEAVICQKRADVAAEVEGAFGGWTRKRGGGGEHDKAHGLSPDRGRLGDRLFRQHVRIGGEAEHESVALRRAQMEAA